MRFRLLASYRGVPYEAGVGPSHGDVVLFAACPPPEELGFEPATGHWRKQVIRAEVDALWESRPVGTFGGEPCMVLDDLGDRLHIAYLGADAGHASQLGYWQVDRGVFELLVPREVVTGLAEERVEQPLRWTAPVPANLALPASPYGHAPWPDPRPPDPGPRQVPGGGAPGREPREPASVPATGGRAARRQRVPTREIFCELADLAGIPRAAYALETETESALCLVRSADGFEVFLAAAGARHEVRSFADEEAAFFYLFGVLVAEAVRNGALVPSEALAFSARPD